MASQCVFCGCIVLTTHPRNPQPKFEGVRRSFLLRSISTLQVRATKPEQTNRQNASFDRLGERQGRVDLWGPPVTCVCAGHVWPVGATCDLCWQTKPAWRAGGPRLTPAAPRASSPWPGKMTCLGCPRSGDPGSRPRQPTMRNLWF